MTSMDRLEAEYQKSATRKRVGDVHKIADLLGAYHGKTGQLPLNDKIPRGGALTIVVGAAEVERQLQPQGNPFGPEPVTIASGDLLAALRVELGSQVTLPVDPQKVGNGAPNAYYVRFRANGQYLVAGFLRQPYGDAPALAPTVYGYGLRSKDGDWGALWNTARIADQVPESEREAIRVAGAAEDRRFGQWVERAQD